MKFTLNDVVYYVYWQYHNKFTKSRHYTLHKTVVRCFIKFSNICIMKDVTIDGVGPDIKSKGRKLSLNLVLHAAHHLNKADRSFIWSVYKDSQHGSLADERIRVKDIIKAIKCLTNDDKELVEAYFLPKEHTKLISMVGDAIFTEALG